MNMRTAVHREWLTTRRTLAPRAMMLLIAGAALTTAGPLQAADEVDRIREKAGELRQQVISAQFDHWAEGKESNLLRVYKDFDYLLKDSKSQIVQQAAAAATDPEKKDRLQRLDRYMLGERMMYAVAPSLDNMNAYETSATMAVSGTDVELTLRSYRELIGGEENRSNRRIWYLASRDLQENANVFRLNLLIDLNKQAQTLAGTDYPTFLAQCWGIDPAQIQALAEVALSSTEDEYRGLLEAVTAARLEGKGVDDVREYDVPYLLRASHLDDVFQSKKAVETAEKWSKKMGIGLDGYKKLRVRFDTKGTTPVPSTFPINNDQDTRVTIPQRGGLSDFWNLFWQVGEAEFFVNIDPNASFEARRVGSPLVPMTYGHLFQSLLGDPAWRAEYLKADDADAVSTAVRFRQLHDLRQAAARYLFQTKLYADVKIPPTEYTTMMQAAMLYSQGAQEEANFLTAVDLHHSGLHVLAAARSTQLQRKLAGEFGETWWMNPDAGKWLKQQWAKGYPGPSHDLAAGLGLDASAASAFQ